MTAVHVLATPDEGREADVEGGAPIELTVAFTDLEDFTTYTEAEGDDAASRLLIGHHRESEPIGRSRGGRVLKRLGDGLMLTFPEPEAAVLACLELSEAAPLRLRAGIHGGKVLVTGDDVIGHVVNLTARVTESAAGAELVVTDHVRTAVGDLRGVAFDGPYTRSLKGIEEKVPVYLASRLDRPLSTNAAQHVRRPKVQPAEGHGMDWAEHGTFLLTAERFDRDHARSPSSRA